MSSANTPDPYIPNTCFTDPQGGEESVKCICDALDLGLTTITDALSDIDNTLEKLIKDDCELVDKCKDEIIQLVDEHFRFPTKTCEECKSDIQSGLGGTLEFAISCAGACMEEVSKCESMTDEGKPCHGCGCEPCICTGLECVSVDETACEEDKKPKAKFVGWCNPLTGSIAVTEQNQGPPGVGFVQVALGESEIAVAEEASRNCRQQTYLTPQIGFVEPIAIAAPLCDIQKFYDTSALNILSSQQVIANMTNASAIAANRIYSLGIEGFNVGTVIGIISGAINSFTGAPMALLAEFSPQIAGLLGCNNANWTSAFNTLAAVENASRLVGVDVSDFTTQIRYAMHAGCRQRFLDPESAMRAYLADTTGQFNIDAHWAIAGLCNQSVNDYIQAQKSKPLPLQLAVARRRKYIDSQQYATGMRQQGYLETSTSEMLFNLTEQVPTLTDIIQLMVRDADDEELVNRLQLDTQFDRKYGRQLRKWSEDQGVPELFAKYAWRAHWHIPSPGQLFTFYHRLRNSPQFGPPERLLGDIKAALIQQDILPYWHEHYLATSFVPMGRIDIRRAYNVGTLTDDDLIPAYQQLGYNDETCKILATFTKRLRDVQLPNHRAIKLWLRGTITAQQVQERMQADGIAQDAITKAMRDAEVSFETGPIAVAYLKSYLDRQGFIEQLVALGVSQDGAAAMADRLAYKRIDTLPIKEYISGGIDRADVEAAMQADNLPSQIQEHLLSTADKAIDSEMRVNCQRGIKRRYLHGEMDTQEAVNMLTNYGTTLERANKLVGFWDCEKSSGSKTITAARLCHWLSIGLIQQQDFIDRLVRIGYKQTDADMIMYECVRANTVRQVRDAEALQKKQQAEANRQQRIILAAERRAVSDATRIANMNKQRATLRANRDKQMLSAAEKVFSNTATTLPGAVSAVTSAIDTAKSEFGLTIDQALKVVILAAETAGVDTVAKFLAAAHTLAQAASQDQLEPTDGELIAASV